MASKFAQRSNEAELMDDLESSGEVIDQTLRELETINKWLGGNHVTINGLDLLMQKAGATADALTIVDLGCGGGDMLMMIADWARKRSQRINLIGIDANPNIIAFAQRNTRNYPEITYKSINIFSEEFKALQYDIATSTLFTHHFNDQELIDLFDLIKSQASIGMVINDLHRHWFAYHSIKWLTAAFSRSVMVRNDAAVSVLRSFHKNEIEEILKSSGVSNYSIQWMWAFRWQLVAWF
ncbi:class I SAM-dependent methyltransferase [Fulvivirga kasyanovii]|uniref:Methyltransferase domain-containing protein n=1 Tax=Fulvivirga kasyanovii TaxID=396812 RepID=A0ABW9RIA2_9BACT|nr:methyltransferase domain-containing protein [Fulvivirga kasyanovii]MTI23728.1 methyltransferase domain-containing protein [Fulvivirga kasyanovii]